MKSWELRKCLDHSRENMHTDVRVKSVKGIMELSPFIDTSRDARK